MKHYSRPFGIVVNPDIRRWSYVINLHSTLSIARYYPVQVSSEQIASWLSDLKDPESMLAHVRDAVNARREARESGED